MTLLRCDRCGTEYKGVATTLTNPSLSEYGDGTSGQQRWDLCTDCRAGLEDIFKQCRQIIGKYLGNEYARLYEEYRWKAARWSR